MTKLILIISLILLHEGITYYISYQILALLTISFLILKHLRYISINSSFIIGYVMLCLFLLYKSQAEPLVIDQDGSDIMRATIGIAGYAFIIAVIPHLRLKRPILILNILRYVSSRTILILAGLLIISELGFIPFLSREALLKQNTRLVDNWVNQEVITGAISAGEFIRHDLFYGESSALAVVFFSCTGCFIFCSKLTCDHSKISNLLQANSDRPYNIIIIISLLCMFYIQSFSSIIYALTIFLFAFLAERMKFNAITNWKSIVIIFTLVVFFTIFAYEYFFHRITMQESQSLDQRFGILSELSLLDFLLGVDINKVPVVGFHNGFIYIIAISGFGGFLYIITLSYTAYKLSSQIKLSLFAVILILGIMMQNGGVFTPNKVVLFSLILLPLACGRSIYLRQQPVATARNANK
jgi:hypothetical protein